MASPFKYAFFETFLFHSHSKTAPCAKTLDTKEINLYNIHKSNDGSYTCYKYFYGVVSEEINSILFRLCSFAL